MFEEQQTRAECHHHRHYGEEERRHSHHQPEWQRPEEVVVRVARREYRQEHEHRGQRGERRHRLGHRENSKHRLVLENWYASDVVVASGNGKGRREDDGGDKHRHEHARLGSLLHEFLSVLHQILVLK